MAIQYSGMESRKITSLALITLKILRSKKKIQTCMKMAKIDFYLTFNNHS